MTTLLRKQQKQPPAPETFNLHQIEAWASLVGNEVHYDPRRTIVTRKIPEYVPCPQGGDRGQWRETYRDDLVEAALWAASPTSLHRCLGPSKARSTGSRTNVAAARDWRGSD
jgi:hypothetical protein